MAQAEKLFRHNRQGSFKTRERYFEAYQRFLKFLAEEFHLKKISNVSEKHLTAYVEHMQEKGLAASTVKTDLAAIRFWHDQIPDARYTLPGNEAFDLERRSFGGVDRTWSKSEFEKMRCLCREAGHFDYEASLTLARFAGLRIHECFRIDTAAARKTLKTGNLTVKGKGGKIREIPINSEVRRRLERGLRFTPEGHKLFVTDELQTHVAIGELQNFIVRHREDVRDEGSANPLTFHGLRHTYAAGQYQRFINEGLTEYQARLQVSKLLGHERDDVTRVYLASVISKEGKT